MGIFIGNNFANSQGRSSHWAKHFSTNNLLQVIRDNSNLKGMLAVLFTQSLYEKEQAVETECLSCLEKCESRWYLASRYHRPEVNNVRGKYTKSTSFLEQRIIVFSTLRTKAVLSITEFAK